MYIHISCIYIYVYIYMYIYVYIYVYIYIYIYIYIIHISYIYIIHISYIYIYIIHISYIIYICIYVCHTYIYIIITYVLYSMYSKSSFEQVFTMSDMVSPSTDRTRLQVQPLVCPWQGRTNIGGLGGWISVLETWSYTRIPVTKGTLLSDPSLRTLHELLSSRSQVVESTINPTRLLVLYH